jgi:tetratricopeptide (TPR) repeat protein
VAGAALLAGLLALAVWQVRRLPEAQAMAEAQAAERERDDLTALRRSLDRLDRAPTDPVAAQVAARALTHLHFPDEAEPYYEQAQRAGGLTTNDLQERAFALTLANRLDPAARVYEAILKLKPDDPLALRRLATVRFQQARYRDALALAERLERLPGQAVVGAAMIGTVQHEQKHADRAVVAYERVLQLDPELRELPLPAPLFWTNLSSDLIVAGQPGKARLHLERELARRRDPRQMDLLGVAHQWEGDMVEAERCYRQAAEWNPQLAPAWLHLGKLLLQPARGQTEEAIAHLKKAAELEPESVEAPYTLSLAFRRLRRQDEADRYQKLADELRRQAPPAATGMSEMPGQAP